MAALVYGLYGFHGPLIRDDAIYAYSGQRAASGIPPYLSIFDAKPPLPSFLAAIGVLGARVSDSDELMGIRAVFFFLSLLTVVCVYLLGTTLFSVRLPAVLSALVFLAFDGFARHAAAGPRAKGPMVLFVTLSLWLTSRRKWFWAGLCGALAALCWQPTAVYPLVTLIVAARAPVGEKYRAIGKTLSGISMPLVLTVVYFGWYGALFEFFDATVLFIVFFLEHSKSSILMVIHDGYTVMTLPIFIGLLMNVYFYMERRARHDNYLDTLTKDRFSPLLLSFPLPIIWSMHDFQGYPDFFVFLPYAAVGFGYFLYLSLQAASDRLRRDSKWISRSLVVGVCGAILSVAFINAWAVRDKLGKSLDYQSRWASEIETRYGNDMRFLSIGAPQLLVLLRRTNPTRYIVIVRGFDEHIDARIKGGLKGWLFDLEKYDPDVIGFDDIHGDRVAEIMEWLNRRYQLVKIGPWKLFVKD
jgi:hypothetical protein